MSGNDRNTLSQPFLQSVVTLSVDVRSCDYSDQQIRGRVAWLMERAANFPEIRNLSWDYDQDQINCSMQIAKQKMVWFLKWLGGSLHIHLGVKIRVKKLLFQQIQLPKERSLMMFPELQATSGNPFGLDAIRKRA